MSHGRVGNAVGLLTGLELGEGGRVAADSSARVAELEKQYERDYGSVHVPFFHGSFEQARSEAQRSKSLLIACFISRRHPATPRFLLETLGDPKTAQTLSGTDRILLWLGDVYYADTFALAGRLGIQQFPAALYLAYVERRLLPLQSLQGGVMGANRLLEGALELLDALTVHEQIVAQRSSSQSASQRIREEQDAAYQRSLAADAKKEAERQRAEQERRQAEDRRAQELADRQSRREERLRQLTALLPPEAGEEDGNALRLSLQLLDGRRVIRRFGPDAGLADLYNWAFTLVGEDLDLAEDAFVIRTMLPPVIFERDGEQSLTEAGIQNQMKLIVERKDDE